MSNPARPSPLLDSITAAPEVKGCITVTWTDCFTLGPVRESATFFYAGPFRPDTLLRSALSMREIRAGANEAAASADVEYAMTHGPKLIGVQFHEEQAA